MRTLTAIVPCVDVLFEFLRGGDDEPVKAVRSIYHGKQRRTTDSFLDILVVGGAGASEEAVEGDRAPTRRQLVGELLDKLGRIRRCTRRERFVKLEVI